MELTGTEAPPGIILAGGAARRMGGGDKGLLGVGGRPILARIGERLAPQTSALAISANGDPGRFAEWGLPVLPDREFVNAGPLAGILAGLIWARSLSPRAGALLSVPSDTPFLPCDLVSRLAAARQQASAGVAVAASRGRTHFVVALWSLDLAGDLERALAEEGLRKVEIFARRYRPVVVDFPSGPVDPFFNVNRPEDLEEAEKMRPDDQPTFG